MSSQDVQPGQLWTVGPHRLLCGDCTAPGTLARLLAGVPAPTLVYSDPPWEPGWHRRFAAQAGVMPSAYPAFVAAFVAALPPVPLVYLETGARWDGAWRQTLQASGWLIAGQWPVTYANGRGHNLLTAWSRQAGTLVILPESARRGGAALVRAALVNHLPGIVLDPCLGLGLTARVAQRVGWICYGVELVPVRLARAVAGLARLTGATPQCVDAA